MTPSCTVESSSAQHLASATDYSSRNAWAPAPAIVPAWHVRDQSLPTWQLDLRHEGRAALAAGAYLGSVGGGTAAFATPCPPAESHTAASRGPIGGDYIVVLLTDVSGVFESAACGRLRIDGDAALFLMPGTTFRFRCDRGTTGRIDWVSFGGSAIQRLVVSSSLDARTPVLPTRMLAAVRSSLSSLHAWARGDAAESPADVMAYLLRVTLGVATVQVNHNQPAPASSTDEVVDKARQIIWAHQGTRPLSVNEVARHLPVTRRTLDRRFAQVLGRSVLDEINACRLARAKQLLESTDMLVKTVSYMAGFPSRERMRLLFLAQLAMTPTEYRERHRRQARRQAPGKSARPQK